MKIWFAWITSSLLIACSPAGDENALGDAEAIDNREETAQLRSGPFGFDLGMPISELGRIEEEEDLPNHFVVNTPPRPHPDIDQVVLVAYPEVGVCTIRGFGRLIENDGSGGNVRSKVDDLAAALATRYGDGEQIDVCSAGSVACESQFWMMSLLNNRRGYGWTWNTQSEEMEAAGIGGIVVVAEAADIQTSYVVVEFNSADEASCENAKLRRSAEAF